MGMLVQLGVSAAFYVLSHVYHRIVDDEPKRPRDIQPPRQFPVTEAGTPIPLVFGRDRVRQPILAWRGPRYHENAYWDGSGFTTDDSNEPSHVIYSCDLLFSAGIGMGLGTSRGNSLAGNKLHNVWWNETKLPSSGSLPRFTTALKYGQMVSRSGELDVVVLRGAYYFHGGWHDQSLTSPASKIGDAYGAMHGATLVPGLAKQMLVSFVRMPEDSSDPYFNQTVADPGASPSMLAQPYPQNGFIFGTDPSVSSVSVEVSAYGDAVFAMRTPGVDFGGCADPAECIYDVLTNPYGRLGLPTAWIDTPSFTAASQTLKSENHGYSRVIDSVREARDIIDEILIQIDGVLRLNQKTQKIELKLIRPDYDTAYLPKITRYNCRALENGAVSGWVNIINVARVAFPNRDKEYEDDSESAQNVADTADGVVEEVMQFPGCKKSELAKAIAARELAWRSKPLMKLIAYVDRSFLRLSVGDPVMVNWTDPDISNLVFRVAAVNHGTLTDTEIVLTLVQDASYVYRNRPPQPIDYGTVGPPKVTLAL